MKSLLALLLIFSTPVLARTQSIFRADGSKATVMVIGMGSDQDANQLFKAMTAPEQVLDGKPTKRMNFDRADGTRIFSIVCVMSGIVAGNGTCTVIFNAGEGLLVDKNNATAQFISVDGHQLNQLMSAFVIPSGSNLIYVSSDSKLQISILLSEGQPRSFEMIYR